MEELIDDFVDGRLPESDRHEVERHIEECAACRHSVEQLRTLVERAAALPKEIRPARDLMPGIRRAVEQRGRPRATRAWIGWAGLAASVLLLVTLGITTMTLRQRGEEAARAAPAPDAMTEIRAAEQEYLKAAELLAEALERQRGSLSPETAALVEENLEIINRAIANVQLALNAEPGNAKNGQVLTALYQQKIEILRRVSRLSS
jgi:hypothetical protein